MAKTTFYHAIPNSRFIDGKGNEHFFFGGELTTEDPQLIVELTKVANSGGSKVFLSPLGRKKDVALEAQVAAAVANRAAESAKSAGAAAQK